MKIRRAITAADQSAIDYLQCETLPGDKPLDSSVGDWWIVYDAGAPVAFAGMKPSTRWTDCMYLCRSGVLPSHRGMGLQKRLIMAREHFAYRLGMNWLISDTTQNPASSNSLISRGFRLYEPANPWGGRYTLYWRKKL